jgi:hypothetical protein
MLESATMRTHRITIKESELEILRNVISEIPELKRLRRRLEEITFAEELRQYTEARKAGKLDDENLRRQQIATTLQAAIDSQSD